jgi:hypothetical protein
MRNSQLASKHTTKGRNCLKTKREIEVLKSSRAILISSS